MTLGEAIEFLQGVQEKVSTNTDLNSAIESLTDIHKVIKPNDPLNVQSEIVKELVDCIQEGQKYASIVSEKGEEFERWAKDLYACALNFKKEISIIAGHNFVEESSKRRQRIIYRVLIAVIVIAAVTALGTVCGLVIEEITGLNSWVGTPATALGTIDFAVGCAGFLIERIYDMKGKSVERQIEKVKTISSKNVESIEEWCDSILKSISMGNQFAFGKNIVQSIYYNTPSSGEKGGIGSDGDKKLPVCIEPNDALLSLTL